MSIGCAPAPTGCGVTERLTTELGGRREVARRKSAGKDQTRSYSKPRKSCGGMPLRVTRAGRQQFGASPLPGDRTMARRSNRHRSESFGAVGVALGALDVHLEYLISRPCLRPLPAPGPFVRIRHRYVLRQIAPDARKIGLKDVSTDGLGRQLIRRWAESSERYTHVSHRRRKDTLEHVRTRDPTWLHRAAQHATEFVLSELRVGVRACLLPAS